MRSKKLSRRLKSRIRICGRDLDLIGNYLEDSGGHFDILGRIGQGHIKVNIGRMRHGPEILETLLHEILEAIWATDNVRYLDPIDRPIFVFDHNYLDTVVFKVIDALRSCGAIEIPDRYTFGKVQGNGKGGVSTCDSEDGDE